MNLRPAPLPAGRVVRAPAHGAVTAPEFLVATAVGERAETRVRVVLILYAASGAAGLIYEVVWQRSLALVIGSTTTATAAVLAAFLGGLALGAYVFGRLGLRTTHPLRMYAALEFAVAAMAGSLTILVWPQATRWSSFAWRLAGDSVTGLLVARLGVAAVFLLLPAALMGGTFPVLARYRPPLRSRDSWVPALYTANTLGAVAGAVGSGFLLLPLVGAARTAAAAMSLNAVAAMMALGLARSASAGSTPDSKESDETRSRAPAVRRRSPWRIWLLLLLAGAVTLAFEVIWTRALTLVLGSSTYAFATMLATYIGGLALGALVATRLVSSFRQDVPCLIWVQLGSALGALIALHLVPTLPVAFLYMFRLTGDHPVALTVGMSALAVGIMFPTAVSQGMVFPIGVHAVTGGHPDLGGRAGLAYAVSTCGAVLGALITTFWLIPALGIDHAGGAAAAVSLCAAGLAVSDGEEHRIRVAGGVAIAACALALSMFFPTWDTLRLGAGIYRDAPRLLQLYPSPREFPRIFRHYRPVLHRDGAGASVLVYDRPSLASLPHRVLVIDGKVEASTADDMSTQVLSGHLPLMVGGPSGRALVIGVASGITLGALAQHPFRDIVAAEIEPAVLDAARTFRDFNHDALSDPRVHVVLDDGRHYLAAVTDPFDVIVSEPSNPWIPGSARLFTLEFFQQVRAHLQDGGVFAQWIQLYGLEPNLLRALVRTFQSIFPEVLVVQASDGDLLLLGAARPLRLDYARTAELLTHRQVADDLSRIGIHNPAEIAVRLVLGGADVKTYAGSGVLNTDDNALLEFAASRTLYRDTITANAEALAVHAPTVPMSYIQRLGETADARAQAGRAVSRAYLGGERGTAARRAAEWSQMEAPTADGWWLLGQAASQLGDAAEAGRAWRRALALDPQHADARLALARLAWRRGDLVESGAVLGPLLLHWDTAPAAALYLRGLLTARGDAPRAAVSAFDTALARWPDVHDRWVVRYALSASLRTLGDERAATRQEDLMREDLRAWCAALQAAPPVLNGDPPLTQPILDALAADAAGLTPLMAREVFEPLNHFYRGRTLDLLGYPTEAARELERAVQLSACSTAREYLSRLRAAAADRREIVSHRRDGGQ